MSALFALVVGLAVGSAPTADWLGRWQGVDLRAGGSGNPGANNAFQLGGPVLGGMVLAVEFAKGALSVWAGAGLGGAPGAALGGMGATLGNVYNPWYRLRGGKGLGITAGAVTAAWPPLAGALLLLMGAAAALLRRSGPPALLTLVAYLAASLAGPAFSTPGRWAIPDPGWMAAMAAVQTVAMAPKHVADTLRRSAPPGSRGGS